MDSKCQRIKKALAHYNWYYFYEMWRRWISDRSKTHGYTKSEFAEELYNCGEYYYHNVEDFVKAVVHYGRAAALGLAKAQHMLAVCYRNGTGVAQNIHESGIWLKLAARQGLPDALFSLAVIHDTGDGAEHDVQEAVRLYQLAADKGHCMAQFNLASCLRLGDGTLPNGSYARKKFPLNGLIGQCNGQWAFPCTDHILGVHFCW